MSSWLSSAAGASAATRWRLFTLEDGVGVEGEVAAAPLGPALAGGLHLNPPNPLSVGGTGI